MQRLIGLALAGSMLWAAPTLAQETGSRMTREFVQAAAQSDTFEILEAQTALVQSTDPDVRAFAQEMIQAHTTTRDALQAAASRAGLRPPSKAMGSDQALLLNSLQSLRGAEFDKMYVRHQALAHRSALVTEEGYASGGDQPDIRAAATSAAPLIASHLKMAEQMQTRKGG
jgi:putative membrane protein